MPDTPSSYPSWRFYADGRGVIVNTPQELAALPPGHAGSPVGPFPDEATPPEPEPEDEADEADEEVSETDLLREQAQALLEQGLTIADIGRAVHRSPRTVRRWLGI